MKKCNSKCLCPILCPNRKCSQYCLVFCLRNVMTYTVYLDPCVPLMMKKIDLCLENRNNFVISLFLLNTGHGWAMVMTMRRPTQSATNVWCLIAVVQMHHWLTLCGWTV